LLVEYKLSTVLTLLGEGSAFVARATLVECAGSTCTELGEMGFISDSFRKTAGGTAPLWTTLQNGDVRLRETTCLLFSAVSDLLTEIHEATGGGGAVGL
jgi:hypothetical protein